MTRRDLPGGRRKHPAPVPTRTVHRGRRRTGRRPTDARDAPGTSDFALRSDGVMTLPRGHLRKDGQVIPVEVSARLVRTPRGDVVVNIVRDVQARVVKFQAAERPKGGPAGDVVTQLRGAASPDAIPATPRAFAASTSTI